MPDYCQLCGERERCCGIKKLPTFAPIMKKIWRERDRARRLGLPATLMLYDYLETLEYFRPEESAWACVYCGQAYPDLSIDHWQALSAGGGTVFGNCVPACKDCNTIKGSMSGDEFFYLLIHKFKVEGADKRYAHAREYFAAIAEGRELLPD